MMLNQHIYNFVAKRIREDFPQAKSNETVILVKRGTLTELALRCAHGFLRENPNFDPLKFLESCSPNPEIWPIQELWEQFNAEFDPEIYNEN